MQTATGLQGLQRTNGNW